MWNRRCYFLGVHVKTRGKRRNINLFFPLALYVLSRMLLLLDGLLGLIPGEVGRKVRQAADTFHCIFETFLCGAPQTYAHVEYADEADAVYLKISTVGRMTRIPLARTKMDIPRGSYFFAVWIAGTLAFAVNLLIFPAAGTWTGVLFGGMWLALFFTVLRPVGAAITLPFDLLFMGLALPFVDALFLLWAAAWSGGLAFGYMQCLLAAYVFYVFMAPYALARRSKFTTPTK